MYYKQLTDGDMASARESAAAMQEYIKHSEAVYTVAPNRQMVLYSLYIPQLFTGDAAAFLENICDTTYKILEKIISEYESNAQYRSLFGFDKRLEELIARPARYASKLPIARFDIFFNPDDFSFKFCEFNADGTSAMDEDRILNIAVRETETFKKFSERYEIKTYELFDSWVDEFLNIYRTCQSPKARPNVAIVDFIKYGPPFEFKRFKAAFCGKGINCEICDIRDLSYVNGRLVSPSGMKIDAVYRRAVTCDIMADYDNVQPFINAVMDENVVLIGDFKTQVIHNKLVFAILHHDMTKQILTPEENSFIEKHIPFTAVLTENAVKSYNVLSEKNKWVIKPQDSYASKGFHAGVECESAEEWEKYVTENIGGGYILQEYIQPYETENIDLLHDPYAEYRKYSSITGLFVYNGKFSGIYSRIAKTSIISTQYSEMSLPSIVAHEK